MIQRIQTIFLAVGGGLLLSVLGLPFATTPSAVTGSAFFADATYSAQDHPALLALFGLGGLLAIVGVFLFRNRLLQMRLTIFSAIAAILAIALTVLLFLQESKSLGDAAINDGVGAYLPILGLVCLLLAYWFIGKDEKLVRSMDRLR